MQEKGREEKAVQLCTARERALRACGTACDSYSMDRRRAAAEATRHIASSLFNSVSLLLPHSLSSRPSGENFNINTAAVATRAQLFFGGTRDVGFPTLFNLPTPPSTVTILGSGNEK